MNRLETIHHVVDERRTMQIAMEIPDAHLEELSTYVDFDFCLTHILLREGPDSTYAKFYRKQREAGRDVWMDNSFHELGHSLPLSDILDAAKMITPTHVVAFEVANDSFETYLHVLQLKEKIEQHKLPYKIVGTWQGGKKGLAKLESVSDIVALPFRRARHTILTKDNSRQYHFFGIRTLDEIRRFPPRSIDTSAPIKYVLMNDDMKTRERRLRAPLLDYKMVLTDIQLGQVVDNINLMRLAAQGK